MRAMSSEQYKEGMRLKFVDEKLNLKNTWWVAIGETPFFWLVVRRNCEGRLETTVHAASKSELIPYEEEGNHANRKPETSDPSGSSESVDDFI